MGCPEVAGSGGTEDTLAPPEVHPFFGSIGQEGFVRPVTERVGNGSPTVSEGRKGKHLSQEWRDSSPTDHYKHPNYFEPAWTTPQHTISHSQTLHTPPHHSSNPTTAQHQTTHHG